MKIYLIKASAESDFKIYKSQRGGPPQNIFSAAAALPAGVTIEMTDETAGMKVNLNTDADVVAIFMATPDALRGYALADKFKRKRKVVVFGGLHASFMQDEALEHGDAVIVGESEGIWEGLIEDVLSGSLKQVYKNESPVDLSLLNPYPSHIITPKTYKGFWTVLVSRGCHHHCEFCVVRPLLGRSRYRPVGHVVDEIKRCGARWVELHADNLTADREYCLELFEAVKPLKINWATTTSVTFAEDETLLGKAADSGLKYVLVGLETPSEAALKAMGKGFLNRGRVEYCVKELHNHNIMVDSCVMFGFDEHDEAIFQETLDFVKDVKVDICQPAIVAPFPGSRLYTRLEQEGRILTRDWSKYDCSHAVFNPKNMTPAQLENGASWFYYKYNLSFGKIVKSLWNWGY